MANTILTFVIDDLTYPGVNFYLCSTSTTSEVSIDWGDGSAVTTLTLTDAVSNPSHNYAATGTYNVEITVTSGTVSFEYGGGETSSINGEVINIVTGDGINKIESSAFGWIGNDETDWYVDVIIGPDLTLLQSPFMISYLGDVVIDATGFDVEGESLIQQCYFNGTCTFGSHVTAIPDDCFWDVEGLTSIYFETNIASVGSNIFSSCPDLTDLYFCGETPPTFETDSIDSELSLTIHVPTGTTSDYTTALATISPAPTLTIVEWDPPQPTPVYPESFVNNTILRGVINESKARFQPKINYSLLEQDTGIKWINNKPIYQISFSDANGFGSGNPVDVSSLNIDTLIYGDGIGSDSGNMWTIGSIGGVNSRYFYLNDNKTSLIFGCSESSYPIYVVTIQYTKTTDSAN